MADDDDDPLGGGGTYSQLLFGDDDVVSLGTDSDGCLSFGNTPKMLCFGTKECHDLSSFQKVMTCSEDSSSASSVTTARARNHVVNNNKKRNNGAEKEPDEAERGKAGNPGNGKKKKPENPNAKGKREKLGDRVAALQQLVSPFGKGDTASVLHEAMGYIRFLHEQVEVLCSPYLKPPPSFQSHHHNHQEYYCRVEKDMRSRGLCLVPVDHLALVHSNSNGADFWSPTKPPFTLN